MNRDELLAALKEARAQLDEALEGLTAGELERPNTLGDWSIKDVLSHVTAWDVDLLTNVGLVKRGQKPGRTVWDTASIEAQNQAWHQEYRDRPLERVLADFDGVHQQLLRRVEGLGDAELEAPVAWRRDKPFFKYFVDHVVIHEQEHGAELAEWRKNRRAAS